MEAHSTRPYLIRAIYDWANDNSFTPFLLVDTRGEGVVVPEQFIKDDSIVLNIAASAVKNLSIGEEFISFSARFAGVPQELFVPIVNVRMVYAKENGEGLVLPPSGAVDGRIDGLVKDADSTLTSVDVKPSQDMSGSVELTTNSTSSEPDKPSKKRPHLTIVE